jgi:hypothetical protein
VAAAVIVAHEGAVAVIVAHLVVAAAVIVAHLVVAAAVIGLALAAVIGLALAAVIVAHGLSVRRLAETCGDLRRLNIKAVASLIASVEAYDYPVQVGACGGFG